MKKLRCFLLFSLIFLLVSCSGGAVESPDKEVTLVQLSELNVVLYEGQSYRVASTVSPIDAVNSKLSWVSSTPDVCTVSDGLINALSPGISIVTAKAENGISASVRVEVKEVSEITFLRFDKMSLSLEIGNVQKLKLVSGSSSSDFPITWASSDDSVATVDDLGNVTAKGRGACVITADVYGKMRAACEIKVGEYKSDLSMLADITVRDLPKSFVVKDIDGNVYMVAEMTSYEVERKLSVNDKGETTVQVKILIKGTKTFDLDGEDSQTPVGLYMNMYMENDEHCAEWYLISNSSRVGEQAELEFEFHAVLKPYQRQYYIILSEESLEEGIYTE